MEISDMRLHLKECQKYKSPKWSNKVDAMKPSQVVAVYNKFLEKGLFGKVKSRKRDVFGNKFVSFTQPTLSDIFPEAMGVKNGKRFS